jgi:hypothetical protein
VAPSAPKLTRVRSRSLARVRCSKGGQRAYAIVVAADGLPGHRCADIMGIPLFHPKGNFPTHLTSQPLAAEARVRPVVSCRAGTTSDIEVSVHVGGWKRHDDQIDVEVVQPS